MHGFVFYLKKVITSCLLPPAGPVLLGLMGLLLLGRRPRTGRWLIAISAGITLLLSSQIVASWLLSTLQVAPPIDPRSIPAADAIVVLGGGMRRHAVEYGLREDMAELTAERLRYGAWLAKRSGLPLLLSGGLPDSPGAPGEADVMAAALLQDYGLSARWIENASRDTAENATLSARILEGAGVKRILLVSHAWHMRRALREFQRTRLQVTAAPTRFESPTPSDGRSYLPSAGGYKNSAYALHEWLGLAWLQLRP